MTKTSLKLGLLILALILLAPVSAQAFSVKTGAAVTVGQNETIDGNLYAAGSTILIDGQVKGDVICAGQSIVINGKVDGDVLCAGQSVNVTGEVMGSVRSAANDINLNSKIGRNVTAFAASVILGADSQIGLDALVGTGYLHANGKVDGSLHGGVAMATINGEVGKDVALTIDNDKQTESALIITDKAKIGGNLDYTATAKATIAKNESVAGQINRQLPKNTYAGLTDSVYAFWTTIWLWSKIVCLLGALLIGLVLVLAFKDKLLAITDDMVARPAMAMGWGALLLFVAPIILFFLVFTVIGIPLAFLGALLWLIFMILGKMLVAILAGVLVMGRYRYRKGKNEAWRDSTSTMLVSMVLGIVITYALFTIPLFGWVLLILAKMWGMGALWLYCRGNCCAK